MRSVLKKSFSFLGFFLFVGTGLFLCLVFLGNIHPIFHRSFQVFHLFTFLKTVSGLLMGLNLAILELFLKGNLSKRVLRCSMNRSSLFLKSFLIFLQPVYLSNKEKREPRMASGLQGFTLASVLRSIRINY